MDDLFQPISNLNGVGGKRTAALERLGIATPYDLLYHIPRSYLDFSDTVAIAAAQPGEECTIRVQLIQKLAPQYSRRGTVIFRALVTDGIQKMHLILYNNRYGFDALRTGKVYLLHGKFQRGSSGPEMLAPHILPADTPYRISPCYQIGRASCRERV